jgi:methionyl aminopeptidase
VIHLKSAPEIEAIGRAGAILGALFEELPARIEPEVTTAELDEFAEAFIRAHAGATPAFKGLYGFPATLCVSLNQEVVHGIPGTGRALREGDIVSIDAGVRLEGWYADAARTFLVGDVDPGTRRLVDVTREALLQGIAQLAAGKHLGDVGRAIQATAEEAGFSVVRDLVGHGIGRSPHEEPNVPNFGRPGKGVRLETGMVLAIEPMVALGSGRVRTLADRWTVVTTDGSPSAHFEHTVAVVDGGVRVLTGKC